MGNSVGVVRARKLVEDVAAGHVGVDEVHEKSLRHPEVFEVQGLAHHRNVIHAVAAAGNAPVLRCLLKCAQQLECSGAISKGVKQLVNARGTRGQTPLMLAAANAGGAECVKLLLEAGADPWAADICGGRTALFFAACENAVDSAALLLEATQGQKLSEPTFPNGPDTLYINMRMLAGFTALHVAVVADAQAIVRVMLRYGPRLSTPTLLQSYDFIACTRGTTPLHLAARHGRANIAKMILLAHANLSLSAGNTLDPRVLLDDFGRLPCHLASINQHGELASLLQPGVPFTQALGAVDDLYLMGPPPLKLLAAALLRTHQQETLTAAQRALGLSPPCAASEDARCCSTSAMPHGAHLHAASACDSAVTHGHPQPKDSGIEVHRVAPCTCTSAMHTHPEASGDEDIVCEDLGCEISSSSCCPEETHEDEQEEECCGVCLDAPPSIRLRPCGHTLCASCCTGLFAMRHAEVVACPFCRTTIGAFDPAHC